jgi:predicted O-methyltransferase YrrM
MIGSRFGFEQIIQTLVMNDRESSRGPATEPQASDYAGIVAGLEGWLYDEEVELLYRLASGVSSGAIVEIGSYRGKSTVALALGSRDHHGVPVYAIDPHETFTGVMGFEFRPGDRTAFLRNILRCEVSEIVRLVNLPSRVAAGGWNQPVGLLWIDGDHRYESVKQDLECWQPHLAPGALVALHDSTDPNLGPRQATRETMEAGDFERVDLVGSTTVLRRREGSS